jgi:hypothetical protein
MINLSTCILAKHQLLNVIGIYNSNQLWLINLSTFFCFEKGLDYFYI